MSSTLRFRIIEKQRKTLLEVSKRNSEKSYHEFLCDVLEKAVENGYRPQPFFETRLKLSNELKEKIKQAAKENDLTPEAYGMSIFMDVSDGKFNL